MNAVEATQLTNASTGAEAMGTTPPVTPITSTPASTPNVTDNKLEEGGETTNVSEGVQWLTLFIIGLTVVSLVMNIINNKKQMERLEKDDEDISKKLKEHDINLKRALGKKYESLA